MTKTKMTDSAPSTNDDWQVEDALRTLTRAEEIEADPKLMAKVRKLAAEKMDDMREIVEGKEGELDEETKARKINRIGNLYKSGRLSDKQAAKLKRVGH